MFPPLALVVGWLLIRIDSRTLFVPTALLAGAGVGLLVALVFAYDAYAQSFANAELPGEVVLAFGTWAKVGAAVALAGSITALVAFRSGARAATARFWGIAAISLSTLGGLQIAMAGFDVFSPMRSASAILRTAQVSAAFAADAPFYQVEMYDQTVPFYLGRSTRLVAFRDELALGIDAEPTKQIATTEAWVAEWEALPRGYAMMSPELHAKLAGEGLPMRELARDPRRVIVSRQ